MFTKQARQKSEKGTRNGCSVPLEFVSNFCSWTHRFHLFALMYPWTDLAPGEDTESVNQNPPYPELGLPFALTCFCTCLILLHLEFFFFFSGKERSKKKQRTGDLIRHNMWISQCGHRPLFHACLIDDNGSLKDYLIPNKSQSPPSNPLISWSTVSFFRSTPKYRQSHRASRIEPTIHSLGVRPQHAFPTVSSVTHFLEIFNGAKALLCHCSCCSPFRIPTLLSSHVKQCTCPLALQI